MPTAVLYNMQGAKIGDVELSAALFGAEVNKAVLHESVVNYLANQRQGTQSTKTRTEVAGGGKKPIRQKGTGRARQGSTRAPQWIKGGVALGPKPRDYSYTINKKVKKLAMISALSAKAEDGSVMVIDKLAMDEIKTKTISDMLKAMGVVMKRAVYFITCNGRMMYDFLKVDEDYITRSILSDEKDVLNGFGESVTYKQLTLFDDFQLGSIG